jgi:hypothetical protein
LHSEWPAAVRIPDLNGTVKLIGRIGVRRYKDPVVDRDFLPVKFGLKEFVRDNAECDVGRIVLALK